MPLAAAIPAIVSAGASIYSSSQQSKAAKKAAAGQQAASDQASAITSAQLAPYRDAGASALDELTKQLHTQPEYAAFNFGPEPDYGTLDVGLDKFQASPDYQFTKDEALKATNSNFAARGLGQSGAALKALQDRAGQLASSNYQDYRDYTTGQYNTNRNFLQSDYQNNRNFAYNNYTDSKNFDASQRQNLLSSLYSIAGMGQNAAAGTASAISSNLTSNADNQGQALVAGANANATGLNSAIGALTSAATRYGSSYTSPTAGKIADKAATSYTPANTQAAGTLSSIWK